MRLLGSETCLDTFNTARNVEMTIRQKVGTGGNHWARVDANVGEGSHVTTPPPPHLKKIGFLKPNSFGSRANPNLHKFSSFFDRPKTEMLHSITTPLSDLAIAPQHKGIKHMSRAELEQRRRKRLCFKCGQ